MAFIIPPSYVIFIKITQEEAIRKSKKRKNMDRLDNNRKSLKKRFYIFRNKKRTLIPFFKQNFNLIEIDGNGTSEDVQEKIKVALNLK